MSGDAFDRLEAELREAVRVQATSATAPARARWRVPRRGGLLAATAALVVAGGGAFAATHDWTVGPPADDIAYLPAPTPDAGAGVKQGAARIEPLRVADPAGGPPWALRTFGSTRGGACLQVGQVVDGRFGRMEGDRLRPIAAVPGQNSLCSFVARNGYPVLRGLRTIQVTGGLSDPHRCGAGPCPITAVRTIRYGMLGPAARSATYVDGDGRRGPRMRLDGARGGAYLFVVRTDPAPWIAQERWQASSRRPGRPRGRRPAIIARAFRVTDGVDATFAGGTTLRVAGHGRTAGPLPGVTRPAARPAPDVRAPLTVIRRGRGATATYAVRFRAPVAITRADHHYTLTMTGRAAPRCDRPMPGGGKATTRDIARGELVALEAAPTATGWNRTTWCPGRHTLRVGYSSGSGPFRGRLVGTYSFTVAPR